MANSRQSQEIADGEQTAQVPEEEEALSQKLNRIFSWDNGGEDMVPPSNSSFVSTLCPRGKEIPIDGVWQHGEGWCYFQTSCEGDAWKRRRREGTAQKVHP